MRQGIEKKKETMPFGVAVNVVFHGGVKAFGAYKLFRDRENSLLSLSRAQAVISGFISNAPSQSGLMNALRNCQLSSDSGRSFSLPHTEEFSAKWPMARSALVVLAANLSTRSPKSAATVINTMTEQRRCAAA